MLIRVVMFGCILTACLCLIVSVLSCVAACCISVANCHLSAVEINKELLIIIIKSAVLRGVDLFALKFLPGHHFTINHSWHQKTNDTGLPDGKDRIPVRYLVLRQYRSVADRRTSRRTDGQICRSMYSAC